jgi:hypothetical protein
MADAKRARVFEHPGRVVVIMAALLAVLSLGALLIDQSDTSPVGSGRPPLPTEIESIRPERGELTGLVDDVTIDLRDDLQGEVIIDGVQIPSDQLDNIEQLGVISFRPGPGKEFSRFRAGDNTVVVRYWSRTDPRPDKPPSFSWRFRAAA